MILRLTPAEFQPGDIVHGLVVGSNIGPSNAVKGWWLISFVPCSPADRLPNVPFDVERPERMAEFNVEDVRRMVAPDWDAAKHLEAADRLRTRLAAIDAAEVK